MCSGLRLDQLTCHGHNGDPSREQRLCGKANGRYGKASRAIANHSPGKGKKVKAKVRGKCRDLVSYPEVHSRIVISQVLTVKSSMKYLAQNEVVGKAWL